MEEIPNIPFDKLGAIGILIIVLMAMVLYFCYKININNKT